MTTEGFWDDGTLGSPANLNAGQLQIGSGAPDNALGAFTGLEYLDEDTGDRYRADGSAMVKVNYLYRAIRSGTADPNDSVGVDGDLYLKRE